MPATIAINTVDGSDESAVDLTGLVGSTIDLTNSAAAGPTVNLWEFLEWPVGTQYNQAWLALFPASAATISFIPDVEGTWVVKYTDTNDATTDTIICGVKSRRTALRIPGAGETTEAANTVFPVGGAITNHRGWALTRDLGLKYLDELVTSGSVQIFYLEDGVSVPAEGINAGTPLALVPGAAEVLFPGQAPAPYDIEIKVPKVHVAEADLTGSRYAYIGVLKAGRSSDTGTVAAGAPDSNTSYGYVTQGITSGTFVWVTTSGVVQGELATGGPGNIATLDFPAATWTVGDFVFLSGTTPGGFVQDSDTFAPASTASSLMVPIGIVSEVNVPPAFGSMMVLPTRYGGSTVTSAKTEMFRGIGDYSNIRVGRPSGAGGGGVAGEEDGTIEIVADAGENITAGDVVCISTNGAGAAMLAFKADSTFDAAIANGKRYGIFGVAVQTVLIGNFGHFTIFGEVSNVTITGGASTGDLLFVGSSSGSLGDDSATAVRIDRLDDGSYLQVPAQVIALGTYDGSKLLLGKTRVAGNIKYTSSSRWEWEYPATNVNLEYDTNWVSFDRGNVWKGDGVSDGGITMVGLPNTESDEVMSNTSIYEDTIKGSDLCDAIDPTAPALGGKVWPTPPAGQPPQDMTAATLTNGVWDGGGGAVPRNKLYGTFVLEDERYYDELIPISFAVYGYTDNATASVDVQINLLARVNYAGSNTGGPLTITDIAPFTTGSVINTNTPFSLDYFSRTITFQSFYVPPYDASGNPFLSIDIVLERNDIVNASVMIEKVVLQALYSNKEVNQPLSYVPVIFEKKVPGYTLFDKTGPGRFNVIDDADPILGADAIGSPTVGASMTGEHGRSVSDLVGFIPYDSRIEGANSIFMKVVGKYIGTNPLATPITFNITVQELQSGTNYTAAIPGAATVLTTSSSFVGATGGAYEIHTVLATFVHVAGTDGLRFKIERAGVSPIVDGPGATVEESFQVSNVYVYTLDQDSYGAIQDCYEDSTTLTDVIDANDDTLNFGFLTDFNGFVFPSAVGPSAEKLYVPFKFDKRYDYRKNLYVEVYGYVNAADATPVTLDLAISNFYDYMALDPQSDSAFTTLETNDASIAGRTDVYFIKHSFVLSAKDIWKTLPTGIGKASPDFNQYRNSGNAGLLFRLRRNDANGVAYHATSIRIFSEGSKKTSNVAPYVNVSEKISDPQRSVLTVKSAYRGDVTVDTTSGAISDRTLLGSAHRYYFNFACDDLTIGVGATEQIRPAGAIGSALLARAYGLLIPFNMAIVGVYAYGDDAAATTPVGAGTRLILNVVDNAAAILDLTDDGIINFPLQTMSLPNGGWRWTGNPLNFNVPNAGDDLQEIPLIYLPANYSSTGWDAGPPPVPVGYAGTPWLLQCRANNTTAGAVDLTVNVTVEAIVLPMHDILE